MRGDMWLLSLAGYRRHVDDAGDGRLKRRDVPHDVAELMELARDIEFEDKIIVDVEHYDE